MIRKRQEAHPDGADVLVVFDLDGTLTARDTSLPFVARAAGKGRLGLAFAAQSPLFLSDLVSGARHAFRGSARRGAVWGRWEVEVHRRILAGALRGATREELIRVGNDFALDGLPAFVTDAAMEHFEWHRALGHRCVLASASLDLYVAPWARRVGFDEVVATRVAFDRESRFTGRFDGPPCYGEEKLDRLRQVVGGLDGHTVVAYGDSPGDAPLLAAADHGFMIRGPSSWLDVAATVRSTFEGDH